MKQKILFSLPLFINGLVAHASAVPALEGPAWDGHCWPTSYTEKLLGTHEHVSLKVENETFTRSYVNFQTNDCSGQPSLTVHYDARVESATDSTIDLTGLRTRATPGTQPVADYLNQKEVCGFADWQVGVEHACEYADPDSRRGDQLVNFAVTDHGSEMRLRISLGYGTRPPLSDDPNAFLSRPK